MSPSDMEHEADAMPTAWSTRPLKGSELERYILDSAVQAAFIAKLAPGGSEDISQRIRSYYKVPKNFPASLIPRFVHLAALAGEARDLISILAPHTHWQYSRPIIYKYSQSQDGYIVGLHPVEQEMWYRPVSFITHRGHVFAYEWLDSSVLLSDFVWSGAVSKIHSMLLESVLDDEPVSLGVDFRFRKDPEQGGSYDESGSVEFPINIRSVTQQDFSLIVKGEVAKEIDFGKRESLAVGWPCRSIGHSDLSPDRIRLLQGIKAMLTGIPDMRSREVTAASLLDGIQRQIDDPLRPDLRS